MNHKNLNFKKQRESIIANIPNSCIISRNESLLNLTSLSHIIAIGGSLVISENDNVENLSSLGMITTIGGGIIIDSNNGIENLDGLSLLNSVGGDVQITSNSSLKNINGISLLASVEGDLVITNDQELIDIELFPNPTKGLFYLRGDNFDSWEIFDLHGSKLKASNTYEIDINQLSGGIYLLIVKKGNANKVLKIVKI